MKLKRRFYDSSLNLKNIPIERLVLGIVFGLASAFTIYSFFYVLQESFRFMSFEFEQIPNILSESDRNFYNTFFAGLSVILGSSIFVLFVFSRPNNSMNRFNSKRKRLLNDQIFLSFNFMYWFTKIGLVFGVFSMCCIDFEFLPYFKLLAYLLLIVLYLESWKALSTIFKKNRFKIQLIHLLGLIILTLGLSRIDLINFKAIDKIALKNNPIIDLPQSDFYDYKSNYRRPVVTLKLKLNKDNRLIILTENREEIGLTDIVNHIIKERAHRREEMIPYLRVRISANKDIELKYIKKVEAELYLINQNRIIYEVYNNDLLSVRFNNDRRGINYSIIKPVFELNKKNNIPPPFPFTFEELHFSDTLNISVSNQIKINGLNISEKMLVRKMKNHINKNTLFLYNYDENTKYQDYITVLSSHFMAVKELRVKEQTIFHEYDYEHDEFCRAEKRKLAEKYPKIILEKLNN